MDGRSYITDHIGSLLARTDTAGGLLEGAPIWEAWGAPVSGYSSVGGLRFAGHYTDRATGLSHMQQRYYDPYAGRFLAIDPVATSPGSFNRYWYANNNPYRYVDPDGRYVCEGSKGACAQISEAVDTLNKAIDNLPKGSQARNSLMNAEDGKQNRFYASLAAYSENDLIDELSRGLDAKPSRSGKRNDYFFWIYSTKDICFADSIEGHLLHLKSTFVSQTQELARLANEGAQIRIWIYFGYGGYNGGINGSFVLSDEIINWISSFKGDVSVDVWS